MYNHIKNHPRFIERVFFRNSDEHFIRSTLYNDKAIQYATSHYNEQDQTGVIFLKLGKAVCGHDGIVHGGLTAALIDDFMGEIFYSVAKRQYYGFTAYLKVDYKSPIPHDIPLAVCSKISRHEGRKFWIYSEVRDLQGSKHNASKNGFDELFDSSGTVYATGEALYVVPKAVWDSYQAMIASATSDK
ncbi:HotDog domain-containing protein [Globomyces pollinis-pini]|nr:HotDog domain-containing protein [Globomyces pollinis-pini]